MDEVLFDVGTITDVDLDPGRAVFLSVSLAHHSRADGQPVLARCRLLAPYHGAGYGDWHVPGVGDVALCVFPEWFARGGCDEGYAIAFPSGEPRPPVNGLGGALSATRRVFKGKVGVAYDRHIQDEHRLRVEGNEIRFVQGTQTEENVGAVSRTFRAVVEWFGDALMRLQAATQLVLHGTVEVEVTSDALVEISAPLVQIVAEKVEAGFAGAIKKLVHEDFVALFNTHRHAGGPLPDQQAVIGTHTTLKLHGG